MESKLRSELRAGYRALIMVWFSLLASVVLFGVVLTIVEPERTGSPLPWFVPLVIAIVAIPVVIGVRRSFFGPGLGVSLPDERPELPSPEGPELRRAVLSGLGRLRVGTTLGVAIAELPIVFGFLASFLDGSLTAYLGAAAVSIPLIVVQFPTRTALKAALPPEVRVLLTD